MDLVTSPGEKRIDAAMGAELEHIWSRVRAELAQAVGESTYRLWLEPLEPLELRGNALVVSAPPNTHRWIHQRFGRLLTAGVRQAVGDGATVEIVSAGDSAQAPRRFGVPSPDARAGAGDSVSDAGAPSGALGNPKLTFDHFVIGDSNRLAHAAALAVAEMPAQAYNPLFLCGPPGVGKTHLLSSIANLMLIHSPSLEVRMTTGEAFTNAFVGALSDGGGTEAFKAHFRDVDVLLVDDVQFLERKTRTEEEFFHTFNALYDSGRQIVVSSDRPPADLQALEDRLRERFQSGLVADIKPPEPVTRLAILRKRAQHDGIPLGDAAALELIASRIDTNVRALEGALIRVVAYSSLTGRPITVDLAGEVLDTLYARRAAARPRTIADIQAAACAHFGLTQAELLSPTRSARVAWPRQLAMYLARELTGESLPAIGRQFGGRDHTTVMHACRRAGERVRSDPAARAAVEKLRLQLGTGQA